MSNIHTLKSKDEKSDGSDSEDSNERQGFFVGGSEHSGQEVLGPARNQDGDMVNRLFDAAKNAGAEQLSPEEAESLESSSAAPRNSSFQGGVYRLGGHGQPSEAIATARQQQNAQTPSQVAIVRLTVWTNGLQIDDGPLRPFEDPQNRPLLQSITRGEVPQEIVNRFPGRKVDFQMIRKATEYVPPKVKPFAGEGHRLGAVVPHVVELDSDQSSSNLPGAPNNEEEAAKLLADAQEALSLRSDQPVTRIQVRLPAGQPLVGSFNHGHTVLDLRSFIVAANPALAFQPFQLMTTYPSKVLEDESATLQASGILGAAVLLKNIFEQTSNMAFMYPRHFVGMPAKSDDQAWAKNGNGSAPKPAAQLIHNVPPSGNNDVQNTTQPAELSNPGQVQSQVHVQDVHDYNSDEVGGDETMDEA